MDSLQALTQAVPLLALYLVTLFALAYPLGRYLHRLMQPEFSVAGLQRSDARVLGWLGVQSTQTMSWKKYAGAILAFNLLGIVFLFGLQMLQSVLPLNPADNGLFLGLLVGTVLMIGALTFIPALALAGIVEHLWMTQG